MGIKTQRVPYISDFTVEQVNELNFFDLSGSKAGTKGTSNKMYHAETIQDMQTLAQSNNGECLSTEYINNHTKMSWRCSCGNKWQASYNAIQSGTWCPKCSIKRRANKNRINIDAYKEAAIKKGGKCLSKDVKSCYDKLQFECSKGHQWFGRADQIKNTKQWCPKCAIISKKIKGK